jgi:ribosomal-protein-alanine N-acetyltransferase
MDQSVDANAAKSRPVSPLEGWSLRPVTEEDLPRVLELEQACHPQMGNAWTLENLQAELLKPYGRFLVLTDDETDERIAGYIVFWLMFDECHVLNVAVAPEFRRRGVARFLVRRAVSEAVRKDFKKILLDRAPREMGQILREEITVEMRIDQIKVIFAARDTMDFEELFADYFSTEEFKLNFEFTPHGIMTTIETK